MEPEFKENVLKEEEDLRALLGYFNQQELIKNKSIGEFMRIS